MALKAISQALNQYNESYASSRIDSNEFKRYNDNLKNFNNDIQEAVNKDESEEYVKNIINDFLKNTLYTDNEYSINTKNNIDSTITRNGKLYVMIETKKPNNKNEMLKTDDINRKALHELILYYLEESRLTDAECVKSNSLCEIRSLVVTNGIEWFIFNANDIEKICDGYLERQYYKYKNNQLIYSNDNAKFYSEIKDYLEKSDLNKLNFVYFNLYEISSAKDKRELYKVLSAPFLFKEAPQLQIKEHTLNDKFYKELLYIMGLKEEKIDNKMLITINKNVENTFAAQLYKKLRYDKDIENEEEVTEKTFELIIIWLNRLLFIKLFEGQLISFNDDSEDYKILDNGKISSFDDLMDLFFNVLGKKEREDSQFYNKFIKIPYLNSSLFERQEIERVDININEIKNSNVKVKDNSIFGRKAPSQLPLLKYVIDFLNSYTFCSDINSSNSQKEIIDAAVLGLIFEKINGYKDGSIYTPSVITEYISRETLSKVVVFKINAKFNWNCENLDDVKLMIDEEPSMQSKLQIRKDINDIINTITICDPAVGSGHFLVSALNILIAIKYDLGVLFYYGSDRRVTDYDIRVINDVLTVTDGQGNDFVYNKNNIESQNMQKTLFNEKRIIIEECLFGVDLNPKAVYICQLRLWIELLKNAYYENGIMETLPNIDIKLKSGNSLISKMTFKSGNLIQTNNFDITKKEIEKYKNAVKGYILESNKSKKKELLSIIEDIKENLYYVSSQYSLFRDIRKSKDDMYENAIEWAIEFPEIIDNDGRFVGFDCIIGNPPYIQLQTMHEQADYLQNMKYETFARTGDIYCLFYELGFKLLKPNGILTYITSNKWMKAGYGEKLRNFLVNKTNPVLLLDFAGQKVFGSATVDVNILTFEKSTNSGKTQSCIATEKCKNNLSDFVQQNSFICSFNSSDNWTILNPIEQSIKSKIDAVGIPLKNWDIKINRGILTGFNDAFIINSQKRAELIDLDPKSAEIIRPILRGRDIKRFAYNFADLWLINTHNGIKSKKVSPVDINDYPAIKRHLDQYFDKISKRNDKGDTPYNLRNCIYMDEFSKQKIVWSRLSRISKNDFEDFPRFSLVPEDYVMLDSLCFFTGSDLEILVHLLNSKYASYYFFNNVAILDNGGMQMRQQFVENIPLPQNLKNIDFSKDISIDDVIFKAFGFNSIEINYIDDFLKNKKIEISQR